MRQRILCLLRLHDWGYRKKSSGLFLYPLIRGVIITGWKEKQCFSCHRWEDQNGILMGYWPQRSNNCKKKVEYL
jgi:hypothetical protein